MTNIAPAAGPLIYVAKDQETVLVRRRGRYSLDVGILSSPRHLLAALNEAQKLMVEGLRRLGYEWTGDAFEVVTDEQGSPYLPHVEFLSAPVEVDVPRPVPPSDPTSGRYREALAKWEAAEKALAAKRTGGPSDQVDVVLVSTFRRRVPEGAVRADGTVADFRVHIPERRG